MGCATQGEKATIIKALREEGYQLKHLLKGLNIPKSTYYYEISKVDTVERKDFRQFQKKQHSSLHFKL